MEKRDLILAGREEELTEEAFNKARNGQEWMFTIIVNPRLATVASVLMDYLVQNIVRTEYAGDFKKFIKDSSELRPAILVCDRVTSWDIYFWIPTELLESK